MMACSFLATLVLGVQTGVLVAMGFSLVLFVSKSSKPHIAELGRLFGTCSRPEVGLGFCPSLGVAPLLVP